MLVAATGASLLIWAVSDRGQSPYVAAKALVILAPLLLLLAIRPLVERDRETGMPRWWWVVAPMLALILVVKAGDDSVDALRSSKIGATDHTRQLRALRPSLDGERTLFLGNDDFIAWELPDIPLEAPVIGSPRLPFRAEKPWSYGQAYDIDSLDAATINAFAWVIAPRDAAASAMPAELRLTRRTRSFSLFRRTGAVTARRILPEGQDSAAVLDCRAPAGRRIVRAGGLAGVRAFPVGVAAPILSPGAEATVELPLTAGTWDLVTPYTSERELRIRAPGLKTTLPANLDRPGPRWPIGRMSVTRSGQVRVRLEADDGPLAPDSAIAVPGAIIAVPVGAQRTVPVAEACGRPLDWLRPARPGRDRR